MNELLADFPVASKSLFDEVAFVRQAVSIIRSISIIA